MSNKNNTTQPNSTQNTPWLGWRLDRATIAFIQAFTAGCWRCGSGKFYTDSYGAVRCCNCGASQ